jgi:hypothetical protein
MVSGNTNSGFIDCRFTCTADAIGAELGAPPEMLVVGQLCASQGGQFGGCDVGSCSFNLSTLPPAFVACR